MQSIPLLMHYKKLQRQMLYNVKTVTESGLVLLFHNCVILKNKNLRPVAAPV